METSNFSTHAVLLIIMGKGKQEFTLDPNLLWFSHYIYEFFDTFTYT